MEFGVQVTTGPPENCGCLQQWFEEKRAEARCLAAAGCPPEGFCPFLSCSHFYLSLVQMSASGRVVFWCLPPIFHVALWPILWHFCPPHWCSVVMLFILSELTQLLLISRMWACGGSWRSFTFILPFFQLLVQRTNVLVRIYIYKENRLNEHEHVLMSLKGIECSQWIFLTMSQRAGIQWEECLYYQISWSHIFNANYSAWLNRHLAIHEGCQECKGHTRPEIGLGFFSSPKFCDSFLNSPSVLFCLGFFLC